jgi:hypothetical protein
MIAYRLYCFLLHASSELMTNELVPIPHGNYHSWTQADTIVLFGHKIKMDEGAAVDSAEAVFLQHFVV